MRIVYKLLAASAIFGVASFVVPGTSNATVLDNQDLVDGVYFGSGNGALPQEFTVNTVGGVEVGLRAHLSPNLGTAGPVPVQLVPTGSTYFVPLGDTFNFDYSVDPSVSGSQVSLSGSIASLTITNLGNGNHFTFDPSNALLGDATSANAPGGYQNSERVSFGFLGLGYNPSLDDTFDVAIELSNISGIGTITDDITVQVGAGATPLPGALPLFASGLGVIGLLMRRKRQKPDVAA